MVREDSRPNVSEQPPMRRRHDEMRNALFPGAFPCGRSPDRPATPNQHPSRVKRLSLALTPLPSDLPVSRAAIVATAYAAVGGEEVVAAACAGAEPGWCWLAVLIEGKHRLETSPLRNCS